MTFSSCIRPSAPIGWGESWLRSAIVMPSTTLELTLAAPWSLPSLTSQRSEPPQLPAAAVWTDRWRVVRWYVLLWLRWVVLASAVLEPSPRIASAVPITRNARLLDDFDEITVEVRKFDNAG